MLIDEIDKAPRDFPNDILNEIDEGYRFKIKEIDIEFKLDDEYKDKVLIVITSNFEKNLPEPFLRRCVYCNIEFPSDIELLKIICVKYYEPLYDKIRKSKTRENAISDTNGEVQLMIDRLSEIFEIRKDNTILKKPSTSEILDFFYCNTADLTRNIDNTHPSISTLIKRKEDLSKIEPK